MSLSGQQRIGEIVALRTKVKTNKALQVQMVAAIAAAFQQHGIKIDNDVIPDLMIALPEEVSNELSAVVLPGGTNCS